MADIKFYIEQIQRAIYGEEVRSSIANALTVVNEDNNEQQALRDEVIHARDDMYDYVNDFNEKMNIADITKQQLVDATHSAEGSREQLNQSIKESSETEITLNEIVRIAEKSRNELDKSNLIAGNTKTQLDNIVKKAAYLDDNLADKIQEGNKLKTDLPVLISNEVKKITDAGTEEVRKVTETGDTVSQLIDGFDYKVTEVMSTIIEQGNTSIKAVQTEGTAQTGNVTAEGEKQVQAVQAKGQQILDSIVDIQVNNPSTTYTLQPNIQVVWKEVAELNLTLAPEKPNAINIYPFWFTSGATPTRVTLPATIILDGFVTKPNKKYCCQIEQNVLFWKEFEVVA